MDMNIVSKYLSYIRNIRRYSQRTVEIYESVLRDFIPVACDGDSDPSDEHILEEDVIGVLSEFFRKGKHYLCTDKKYLKYAEKRLKTYKIRRFFVLFKVRCRRGAKRVLYAFGWRRKNK